MAKRTPLPRLDADTPLAEAARQIILARLADVRKLEPDVLLDEPGVDAVHDLRVGTRRLSAALRVLGDRRLRMLRPEVDALKDALGPVRDLHVRREWLRKHAPGYVEELERELRHELRALHKALRHWQRKVAPEILVAAGALQRRGHFGGKRVEKRIFKLARKTLTRASADPVDLHAVRISAKKLRYALELVDGILPEAHETLSELIPFQQSIGRWLEFRGHLTYLRQRSARARTKMRRAARPRRAKKRGRTDGGRN